MLVLLIEEEALISNSWCFCLAKYFSKTFNWQWLWLYFITFSNSCVSFCCSCCCYYHSVPPPQKHHTRCLISFCWLTSHCPMAATKMLIMCAEAGTKCVSMTLESCKTKTLQQKNLTWRWNKWAWNHIHECLESICSSIFFCLQSINQAKSNQTKLPTKVFSPESWLLHFAPIEPN